jgi:hypothetical protein
MFKHTNVVNIDYESRTIYPQGRNKKTRSNSRVPGYREAPTPQSYARAVSATSRFHLEELLGEFAVFGKLKNLSRSV